MLPPLKPPDIAPRFEEGMLLPLQLAVPETSVKTRKLILNYTEQVDIKTNTTQQYNIKHNLLPIE